MTLQWTLVATFLYVEVAVIIILLLPFISPTTWQKIFRSRIVTALTSYASIYFNVILVALVLLLLDAIREISKYKTRLNSSNDPTHGQLHYGPTMELVREFRAQRNFYIAGTALFLWFVFKRLLALITNSAHLIADNHASKSQAESASKAANNLLEELENLKAKLKNEGIQHESKDAELEKVVRQKDDEIIELNQKLQLSKIDLETMKKQSLGLTREFDNLLKENEKLTNKLDEIEHSGENKKNH